MDPVIRQRTFLPDEHGLLEGAYATVSEQAVAAVEGQFGEDDFYRLRVEQAEKRTVVEVRRGSFRGELTVYPRLVLVDKAAGKRGTVLTLAIRAERDVHGQAIDRGSAALSAGILVVGPLTAGGIISGVLAYFLENPVVGIAVGFPLGLVLSGAIAMKLDHWITRSRHSQIETDESIAQTLEDWREFADSLAAAIADELPETPPASEVATDERGQ